MIKPAFSTVACPEWTLERVATAATEYGYAGVELRTEGYGGRRFASEPCLIDPDRVASMFLDGGTEVLCLGTGLRFDEPVRPPVVGFAFADTEREVRRARRMIELAARIGCRFVRVFGFEARGGDSHEQVMHRIVERLELVVAAARHTGVQIALENGGTFPRARDLVKILDRVGSPLLGASYHAATAFDAAEDPAAGVSLLGERLLVARMKDLRAHRPCPLGTGVVPCQEFVGALRDAGFDGPLVFEWDRAWIEGLADPEHVLPSAARTMWDWVGAGVKRRAPAAARI